VNIEEIDKWLDNEYGVSYTELEKLHDFMVDRDREHQEQKDKVVNDLLKRISNLEFDVEDKDRRINRTIEYIKDVCWLDEINKPNSLGHKQTIKVLEILQGSDKE